MGATLSVVNDVDIAEPHSCVIIVYTVTVGHGFVVGTGFVGPTQTSIILSLGRVWYDVDFQFADGIFRTQR